MKIKPIFRFSKPERILRLFRVVWTRGDVGSGGYSAKLSVSLRPLWFAAQKSRDEATVTALGVRLHFIRNFGGIYE